MTRRKRWLLGTAVAFTAMILLTLAYVRTHPLVFNESFWEHAHCIKAAGLGLIQYAEEHDGKFPHHSRGYGNALLLMNEDYYPNLTGPGYDAAPFRAAKRNGSELAEEDCGRVYVQGLTLTPKCGLSNVVILFDKLPTPGGDHAHVVERMWSPLGREVCYGSASSRFVPESEWPEFAKEQTELLVGEGIPRAEAERLYASKPNRP